MKTEQKMDEVLRRVSAAGYRLTHARRLVIQALCAQPAHCTSAQLLQAVRTLDASVGRASVFRVLELLCNLAILRPTYVDGSTPEYILLPENGHHAHIICPLCHRVTELQSCPMEGELQAMAQAHGVQLQGHLLELFGYCPQCVPDGRQE